MPFPTVPLCLAASNASGAALSASVSATSILHGSGKAVLGGGALAVASKIKIRLKGAMGVGASGAGNITFDVRYGGTVITNFGALALRTSSQAVSAFTADIDLQVTVNSTAAAFVGTLVFNGSQALGGTNTSSSPVTWVLPQAGPSTGSNAVDQTAGGAIDVFATWSVSTSGNTITVNDSELWMLA